MILDLLYYHLYQLTAHRSISDLRQWLTPVVISALLTANLTTLNALLSYLIRSFPFLLGQGSLLLLVSTALATLLAIRYQEAQVRLLLHKYHLTTHGKKLSRKHAIFGYIGLTILLFTLTTLWASANIR